MVAKIDRVEDLPEWFDLEKYRGCESFSAADWFEQVNRRYELLELHPSRVALVRPECSKDWHAFVLDFWKIAMREGAQHVREAPLDSPSKGKIGKWMACPDSQPVKQVRAIDLMFQLTRDLDAERNGKAPLGISERWRAITGECSLFSFRSFAEAPLSVNFYRGAPEMPILQVDLGAPDQLLKDAFALWLREARARQKADIARRSRPLYARWARYGLLPYLDLLIWSMETDTHIPDRVMSAAISRHDAGEANLRKTIAPLAEKLMSDLSEIQAQAAVEAAIQVPATPETFEG